MKVFHIFRPIRETRRTPSRITTAHAVSVPQLHEGNERKTADILLGKCSIGEFPLA